MNEGDWENLILFWQKDSLHFLRLRERRRLQRRGTVQDPDHEVEQKRKDALSLLHSGHISKAAHRIISHGIADHSSAAVMNQLSRKVPIQEKEST